MITHLCLQNKPGNTRHGGVGFFHKNSLEVIVSNDLSFDESIVVELKFGRKKIFFTVLCRSPSFKYLPNFVPSCQILKNYIQKFKLKILLELFLLVISKHTHSFGGLMEIQLLMEIKNLLISLGRSQIISEPTHFEPSKNPSCIDLIITDQPNLILDSGTQASLDSFCHHQIIYCKVNFRIPPPPPFERTIWHFNRANTAAIKRSMTNFPGLNILILTLILTGKLKHLIPCS